MVGFSQLLFPQKLARSERWLFIPGMFGVTTSDDYRPVAWMGRYPVDVTTILVALHVAVAVITCLLVAIGAASVLEVLQFDSAAVLYRGQIWRIATCHHREEPGLVGCNLINFDAGICVFKGRHFVGA